MCFGMIVAREREIRNFVKTKYYKINASFGKDNNFIGEWKTNEKSLAFESPKLYNETGFKKEEDAKELIETLRGKKATITELKKTKQKENAPLLFNLAEIQNECTKRFKIKPDETLEVIQSLYEKKLVTYPRTDARVLSTAVAKEISKNLNGIAKNLKNDEEINGYITKMIEEKYPTNNLAKTKYVNDSKITDHYAIIPTGQGFENYNKLPDLHREIYRIIVKRFLAIFYPPAEFSKINVCVNIENETFYANEKICTKIGYLEVLKTKENKEVIKENLIKTRLLDKAIVFNKDYLEAIRKIKEELSIVFLDPPYKLDLAVKAINELLKNNLLTNDSLIIIETDEIERDLKEINQLENIEIVDTRKYGRANLVLLKRKRK